MEQSALAMRFRKISLLLSLTLLGHPALAKKRFHVVKLNESLMQISNQYFGTHQCWQSILRLNEDIPSKDSIEVNQRIEIPPQSSCAKSKRTRSLNKISKKSLGPQFNRKEQSYDHDGFIVYNADGKKERKFISGPKNKYQFNEPKLRPTAIRKKKKKTKLRVVSNVNSYLLQLASYPSKEEAMRNKKGLDAQGIDTFLFQKNIKNKSWYRIQAGPFKSKKAAKNFFYSNGLKKFTKEYLIINTNLN